MKKYGLLLGLLASCPAWALENTSIEIVEPYVRMAPENAPNSAAFMRLKNNAQEPVILVGAENALSNTTELHDHQHADGTMKMVKVESIELKPQAETELKPGSLHMMLMGLKAPLKEGQPVEFTLTFSDGSTKTFVAEVQKK